MVENELHDYIKQIQLRGCEEQTTEVKAGCAVHISESEMQISQ